jgi:hypothetical protein
LENDFERTKGRDFQGSDQIERAVKKSDLICEYIGTSTREQRNSQNNIQRMIFEKRILDVAQTGTDNVAEDIYLTHGQEFGTFSLYEHCLCFNKKCWAVFPSFFNPEQ